MTWLRKLLGLCQHRWKIIDNVKLTEGGKPIGTRHILQCEHCGWTRKRDHY
jgi:hypothetical protein